MGFHLLPSALALLLAAVLLSQTADARVIGPHRNNTSSRKRPTLMKELNVLKDSIKQIHNSVVQLKDALGTQNELAANRTMAVMPIILAKLDTMIELERANAKTIETLLSKPVATPVPTVITTLPPLVTTAATTLTTETASTAIPEEEATSAGPEEEFSSPPPAEQVPSVLPTAEASLPLPPEATSTPRPAASTSIPTETASTPSTTAPTATPTPTEPASSSRPTEPASLPPLPPVAPSQVTPNIPEQPIVKTERVPWVAAIYEQSTDRKYYSYICSGVLIDSSWVLTAATCFNRTLEPSDFRIIIGSLYGQGEKAVADRGSFKAKASELLLHPKFSHSDAGYQSNLALLKLNKKLKSDGVRNVSLATVASEFPTKGLSGLIAGFYNLPDGTVSDLVSERFSVVDKKSCVRLQGLPPTPNEFCASAERSIISIRQMGSAGLVREENGVSYLEGIFSHGPLQEEKVAYFTAVSPQLDWINSAIGAAENAIPL